MPELTKEDLKSFPSFYESPRALGDVLIGEDAAHPVIEASSTGNDTALQSLLSQPQWISILREAPHYIYEEDRPSEGPNDVRRVLAMQMSNLGRALIVAAENGHAAAVSALLTFAKDHDIEQPDEYVSRTMMSKVIRNGHAAVVKAWAPLDPGMLTRRVSHQNMLPLYEAVRQRRTGVAAALLDVGADPFRPNQNPDMQVGSYHKSMLSFAAFHRGPHMTELLLARGLPIAGSGALHTAATLGQLDTMRLLMQHGADVNETLPAWSNRTPMHFAAKRGEIEAMKLLEENGALSDVKDADGKTPAQVLEEAKH